MSHKPVSETISAAKGRWPHILPALGITVPANGQHGACPKCGGKDRFRFDDKGGRGTWICSQCEHGDGLDLVRLVSGMTAAEAAKEVAAALAMASASLPTNTPARKEASPEQKRAMCLKAYRALLGQCIQGESEYLKGKG